MLKGLSFTWFVRCWVAWGMCWCPEIGKVDVMALQILQAWHRPPIKVKSFYKKHCFADLVCSPSQVWSNINKINFDWFWTWMPMLTSSWNNFSLAGAPQSREMVAVLCPTENKIMQLHRWWRAVPRRKYRAGIGLRNARDTGGVYRLWVGETQCSVRPHYSLCAQGLEIRCSSRAPNKLLGIYSSHYSKIHSQTAMDPLYCATSTCPLYCQH